MYGAPSFWKGSGVDVPKTYILCSRQQGPPKRLQKGKKKKMLKGAVNLINFVQSGANEGKNCHWFRATHPNPMESSNF